LTLWFWVLYAWGAPSPAILDVTPLVHALGQDDLVHEAQEVQALWDERCAQGVTWACLGPPATLQEAAERWDTCEPGAPLACLISGWSAIDRSDREAALSSLGLACDEGLDRACVDRSFVALGMTRSPSDTHPALFLGTACGEGVAHACKGLGVAHRFGVGVPLVLNEALRRFERACELGDPSSCSAAVEVRLLQGEEALDRDRDLSMVLDACAQGDPFGCKLALPWAPQDVVLAQRACALGVAEGCLQAGSLRPRGERRDRQQAFAAACRLGLAGGCVALASAKLDGPKRDRDPEQAHQVLLTTCEGGEPRACLVLGMEHLPGGRLERQPGFALECLEKACAQELAAGCLEAAWAYRRGFAGPRQPTLAEGFEARACDLGVVQGCPDR
jgi:TPR repeat protein